jgi:hypothetical protein
VHFVGSYTYSPRMVAAQDDSVCYTHPKHIESAVNILINTFNKKI